MSSENKNEIQNSAKAMSLKDIAEGRNFSFPSIREIINGTRKLQESWQRICIIAGKKRNQQSLWG